MAENDETIEIEDDAEVVVNLDEPSEQPKKRVTQEGSDDESTETKDDAGEALGQAIKAAEEAKRAAEATAAAERARREDAERRAAQREVEAQAALERAETSELAGLEQAIEAANRELAANQSAFQKAMEDGEFVKASEAQVALGRATAKLDRLEAQKSDYESGKVRRPAAAGGPVEQQPVMPTTRQNAVEAYLSGYDLQAQNWLRSHPECLPPSVRLPDGRVIDLGGKQEKHNKMMAGHYDALARGHKVNSDEYFRTIEEFAGYRKPTTTEGKVARSRPIAPSAPVTRGDTPGESPRSPTRVTLNRDQQEHARISYPHKTQKEANALYAKELIEAQKEGKIGRLTH